MPYLNYKKEMRGKKEFGNCDELFKVVTGS